MGLGRAGPKRFDAPDLPPEASAEEALEAVDQALRQLSNRPSQAFMGSVLNIGWDQWQIKDDVRIASEVDADGALATLEFVAQARYTETQNAGGTTYKRQGAVEVNPIAVQFKDLTALIIRFDDTELWRARASELLVTETLPLLAGELRRQFFADGRAFILELVEGGWLNREFHALGTRF
jgi:hypothetical protein